MGGWAAGRDLASLGLCAVCRAVNDTNIPLHFSCNFTNQAKMR